ncbi:hypothetical protein FIBSPDRAFT_107359 [Athelia psychrophila]|uniref:Uncharacterized protein n=1 Tax=Athelia psychrophila TaxID=1759441 RepID=A0A166D6J3_9AGAM|nr:hypothetical protein FIBSPDRAFT_107359 [Fibularhizoctonia sp. CBS 109695]
MRVLYYCFLRPLPLIRRPVLCLTTTLSFAFSRSSHHPYANLWHHASEHTLIALPSPQLVSETCASPSRRQPRGWYRAAWCRTWDSKVRSST